MTWIWYAGNANVQNLETDKLLDIFSLKIVLKGIKFIISSIRGGSIYFVLLDTQTGCRNWRAYVQCEQCYDRF